MKSIIIFLFVFSYCTVNSQTDKIQIISNYKDSIDNILNNTDVLPGDVFCNTITMSSNKRAIGIQKTKISFYFISKEDSVYENGTVQFIPLYNTPLKILVEYNIAARPVKISYYFNNTGMLVYYNYKYSLEDEYKENRYWFNSGIILRAEKYEGKGTKPVYDKFESFSNKDYEDANNIFYKAGFYITMYFKIFETEKLDK